MGAQCRDVRGPRFSSLINYRARLDPEPIDRLSRSIKSLALFFRSRTIPLYSPFDNLFFFSSSSFLARFPFENAVARSVRPFEKARRAPVYAVTLMKFVALFVRLFSRGKFHRFANFHRTADPFCAGLLLRLLRRPKTVWRRERRSDFRKKRLFSIRHGNDDSRAEWLFGGKG